MSAASRLRAAFAFANAPRRWGAMVTLTFPEQPSRPKLHFRRWRQRMRDVLSAETQWGWIMEFQLRGVIHFHVFIEHARLVELRFLWDHWIQPVRRHGRDTDLVRGRLEHLCVTRWLDGLPSRTQAADAFNWGGIVELFRSPEGAARYTAKEASKRAQKELPEGVEAAGRWWFLSQAGRPETEPPFYMPDVALPPFKRVWDKREMARAVLDHYGQGVAGRPQVDQVQAAGQVATHVGGVAGRPQVDQVQAAASADPLACQSAISPMEGSCRASCSSQADPELFHVEQFTDPDACAWSYPLREQVRN